MSIILKDIDLPKEGEILGLRIRADGTAFSILRDAKTEVVLKLNDTQAIQIDRPHGRLIDGDKIFTYDKIAEDQLKEVPTILEEEK